MRQTLTVHAYTIPAQPGLDPIQVYWEDFEPGRGRVTFTCFGSAWTVYFGAMGKDTIREFFAKADTSYLVNRISGAQNLKQTRKDEKYLARIIQAIQEDLAAPAIA